MFIYENIFAKKGCQCLRKYIPPFINEIYVGEAVYYQGKSSDKDVFELMLWLVYLDIRGTSYG